MTEAIGSSAAELARALAAAPQAGHRDSGAAAAAQSAGTSRSGHEGDSVTLSETALQVVKIRHPDGTVAEGRLLTGLKPISPQGERAESEAAIQQMVVDLGIEGDLKFSIELRDDHSVTVTSTGAHAAEIEAAIGADPAFERTLRNMLMSSKIAYESPAMREVLNALRAEGNAPVAADLFAAVSAARDRTAAASYTLSMTQGVLTTAFVDPSGERFGGIVPEEASA